MYFSAQNYTGLVYGDILLSERWHLLGPLEAINGILLFGLSTGVPFAVMSRLVANRLRLPFGRAGEAAMHQNPMPVAGGNGAK